MATSICGHILSGIVYDTGGPYTVVTTDTAGNKGPLETADIINTIGTTGNISTRRAIYTILNIAAKVLRIAKYLG